MVYFLQGVVTKRIKIGSTKDLHRRMVWMQSSDELVCLATMPGGAAEEHALQRRFQHLWSHGEWFEPGFELLMFIGGLDRTPDTGRRQNVPAPWSKPHRRLHIQRREFLLPN